MKAEKSVLCGFVALCEKKLGPLRAFAARTIPLVAGD